MISLLKYIFLIHWIMSVIFSYFAFSLFRTPIYYPSLILLSTLSINISSFLLYTFHLTFYIPFLLMIRQTLPSLQFSSSLRPSLSLMAFYLIFIYTYIIIFSLVPYLFCINSLSTPSFPFIIYLPSLHLEISFSMGPVLFSIGYLFFTHYPSQLQSSTAHESWLTKKLNKILA